MSKHKKRPAPSPSERKEPSFTGEAPAGPAGLPLAPEPRTRHDAELAAAEALERAEAELPPIRGEFDRAPEDYERP